eukprot:1194331-Prorocentrum_minimum.AAC.6
MFGCLRPRDNANRSRTQCLLAGPPHHARWHAAVRASLSCLKTLSSHLMPRKLNSPIDSLRMNRFHVESKPRAGASRHHYHFKTAQWPPYLTLENKNMVAYISNVSKDMPAVRSRSLGLDPDINASLNTFSHFWEREFRSPSELSRTPRRKRRGRERLVEPLTSTVEPLTSTEEKAPEDANRP